MSHNSSKMNVKIIRKYHYAVELLYSGHPICGHLVIAGRFSRNRPNPDQTLIANHLYSGHFYSGHLL